ncbi:MAG: hypothetical protein WKG07_30680 [Hymenobacter sp.]
MAQMLEKLDPHSVYIPATDREKTDAFLQGDYDGVGIEFNLSRDTMTVVAPLSGGPAEQAGVQPGDQVLTPRRPARVGRAPQQCPALRSCCAGPRGSAVTLECAGADRLAAHLQPSRAAAFPTRPLMRPI